MSDQDKTPASVEASMDDRRIISFSSFDEIVADAEMLIASPTTRMLGQWPLGTLLAHIGRMMTLSIDGVDYEAPRRLRAIGRASRRHVLKGMTPGLQLPDELQATAYPETTGLADGLAQLQSAIERIKTETMTAKHPILGSLTHEEWVQLHLRHAELHLSFVLPK